MRKEMKFGKAFYAPSTRQIVHELRMLMLDEKVQELKDKLAKAESTFQPAEKVNSQKQLSNP